jgi:hypothetical protein
LVNELEKNPNQLDARAELLPIEAMANAANNTASRGNRISLSPSSLPAALRNDLKWRRNVLRRIPHPTLFRGLRERPTAIVTCGGVSNKRQARTTCTRLVA